MKSRLLIILFVLFTFVSVVQVKAKLEGAVGLFGTDVVGDNRIGGVRCDASYRYTEDIQIILDNTFKGDWYCGTDNYPNFIFNDANGNPKIISKGKHTIAISPPGEYTCHWYSLYKDGGGYPAEYSTCKMSFDVNDEGLYYTWFYLDKKPECSDIAYDKPVKASGYWDDGYPEKVVDHNPRSVWKTSQSTGAWLYIDLGAAYDINKVKLFWNWDTRFGSSATSDIQVSNDATNWQTVGTSTITASTQNTEDVLTFPSTKARFVRFYGKQWNGGWADIKYIEVFSTDCTSILDDQEKQDFIVTLVDWSPNPIVGKKFESVNVQVKNIGSSPFQGSVPVELRFTKDGKYFFTTLMSTPKSWGPGEVQTISFTDFSNMPAFTIGKYMLKVTVDPEDRVTEEHEDNNVVNYYFYPNTECTDSDGGINFWRRGYASTDGGITKRWDTCVQTLNNINTLYEQYCDDGEILQKIYECPDHCYRGACQRVLPDLSISGIDFQPNPNSYQPSRNIDLKILPIINQIGLTKNEQFWVQVMVYDTFRHKVDGCDTKATYLGKGTFINTGCGINNIQKPGTYTFTVLVDSQSSIAEKSEQNNKYTKEQWIGATKEHLVCNKDDANFMGKKKIDLSFFPELFFREGRFNGYVIYSADNLKTREVAEFIAARLGAIRVYPSDYVDDFIHEPEKYNIISVGTACDNQVTERLKHSPVDCVQGINKGIGYIQMLQKNRNVQVIIEAEDSYMMNTAAVVLLDDSIEKYGTRSEVTGIHSWEYRSNSNVLLVPDCACDPDNCVVDPYCGDTMCTGAEFSSCSSDCGPDNHAASIQKVRYHPAENGPGSDYLEFELSLRKPGNIELNQYRLAYYPSNGVSAGYDFVVKGLTGVLRSGETKKIRIYGSHSAPLFSEKQHCGRNIKLGIAKEEGNLARPGEFIGITNTKLLCEKEEKQPTCDDLLNQNQVKWLVRGNDAYVSYVSVDNIIVKIPYHAKGSSVFLGTDIDEIMLFPGQNYQEKIKNMPVLRFSPEGTKLLYVTNKGKAHLLEIQDINFREQRISISDETYGVTYTPWFSKKTPDIYLGKLGTIGLTLLEDKPGQKGNIIYHLDVTKGGSYPLTLSGAHFVVGDNMARIWDGRHHEVFFGLSSVNDEIYLETKCKETTVPEPACTDSDGGIAYYKKGVVSYGSSKNVDTCNGNTLLEGYCEEDKKAVFVNFECPDVCIAGRCDTRISVPPRPVPPIEKCSFPSGLDCLDKADINNADGTIGLVIKNNLGFPIDIVGYNAKGDCMPTGLAVNGKNLEEGPIFIENFQTMKLLLKCRHKPFPRVVNAEITLEYKNTNSGIRHKTTGQIVGLSYYPEQGPSVPPLPVPTQPVPCTTGCRIDGKCVPFGTRLIEKGKPVFCDISGNLKNQLKEEESCQNNYECMSNSCISGRCTDLAKEIKETRSIMQKILAWLQKLF